MSVGECVPYGVQRTTLGAGSPLRLAQPVTEEFQSGRIKQSPGLNASGLATGVFHISPTSLTVLMMTPSGRIENGLGVLPPACCEQLEITNVEEMEPADNASGIITSFIFRERLAWQFAIAYSVGRGASYFNTCEQDIYVFVKYLFN